MAIGDGTFSSQPGVSFHLHHFAAVLVPQGKTSPSCFSKVTAVSHARITVSDSSLTEVFRSKLGKSDSKIRDLRIENADGVVTLKGNITKIIPLAFTIAGPVTTDGKVLELNAQSIKADGIPIKSVLTLVGEQLSSVFAINGVSGVTINGDRLFFAPELIAHLKGHIQSVRSTPGELVLTYDSPARRSRSSAAQKSRRSSE